MADDLENQNTKVSSKYTYMDKDT